MRKNMRRLGCLVLMACLCLGAAAGPAEATEARVWLESEALGLRFRYPESWVAVQREVFEASREEMAAALAGTTVDIDTLDAMFEQAELFLMSTQDDIPKNLIVAAVESPEATDAQLFESLSGIKDDQEAEYDALGIVYSWQREPGVVSVGGRNYVMSGIVLDVGGAQALTVQATLLWNGRLYTFSYSTEADVPQDEAEGVLNGILETLAFL